MDVKIIDYSITNENLSNDIYNIYCELFDKINQDDLIINELKGGVVNKIIKVFKKDDENNSLIFRTYNLKLNNEEVIEVFDRSVHEIKVMNALSEIGLCKKVIAKYENGIIYPFINGETPNGEIFLSNEFLEEMSIKLAKLHSLKIDLPEIKYSTHYERLVKEIYPMLLSEENEEVVNAIENSIEFPFENFPSLNFLKTEENHIIDILKSLENEDDNINFCHNDLKARNIIWDSEKKIGEQISLIDLETSMNNKNYFDLGYLFMSFLGNFLSSIDFNYFPNDDYILEFLRNYLKEKYRIDNKQIDNREFDDDLELLIIKTNLGILFSLIHVLKLLRLLDYFKDEFRNDEMNKLANGDDYYYCKIADKTYRFYKDKKDSVIELLEDY